MIVLYEQLMTQLCKSQGCLKPRNLPACKLALNFPFIVLISGVLPFSRSQLL